MQLCDNLSSLLTNFSRFSLFLRKSRWAQHAVVWSLLTSREVSEPTHPITNELNYLPIHRDFLKNYESSPEE